MSASDIILKLSNIESYYGPIMAIRGTSNEVPRGQIVTLLGANGAGKTTVLKTISGILDPQKGSIEFLGKPIQRMEADKIVRLGLSHVPEGREVFPFLTVRENLMMGAYPRKDRYGVADDLERVYGYFPRLKERLNQPAGQLSGGEQQMLAIGRPGRTALEKEEDVALNAGHASEKRPAVKAGIRRGRRRGRNEHGQTGSADGRRHDREEPSASSGDARRPASDP